MIDILGNFFQFAQIHEQVKRVRGFYTDIDIRIVFEHIQKRRNKLRDLVFVQQTDGTRPHVRVQGQSAGRGKIVEGDEGIGLSQGIQLFEQSQFPAGFDARPNIQKGSQLRGPDIREFLQIAPRKILAV